jgi:glutaredoxin
VSGDRLTLFSKPGCHLCEDARALVDELQPSYGYAVEEIDITTRDDLFARYRYDIPVVLMNGEEIARGRIDDRRLVELIETRRGRSGPTPASNRSR